PGVLGGGGVCRGGYLTGLEVVSLWPGVGGAVVPDCADRVRMYTAHYLGGMGSRKENFYNRLAARMGYPDAAQRVQELYLDGRPREAAAAIPQQFLERTCLLGPVGRIADTLREHAGAGVTTLSAMIFPVDAEDGLRTLRALADALKKAGVG
ncbi:LLM class flavin-dependent oxidoreductase, partial [Streptomyces sp. NPDC059744]|uniref:LLM class flavin-dependent oxidoreductase n=1 Tax=Streptomyces sp. NPDC059744 TaxID=3346929 RepID=UPI00365AEFA8